MLILIVLTGTGFAQESESTKSINVGYSEEEKSSAFSEAGNFFFATLSENFEGSSAEDVCRLLQIFANPREEPEKTV